ncbi:MAG: PAS domain-containing protein [Methanomicrobiales archaeon]|nr:PAS domain-containing protein [Methanomicrobiales archaeon]
MRQTKGGKTGRAVSALFEEMRLHLRELSELAGTPSPGSEARIRELLGRFSRALEEVRSISRSGSSDPVEDCISLLNAAFENVPEGIIVTDSNPCILVANAAAERILGRPLNRGMDLQSRIELPFTYGKKIPYTLSDLPTIWSVYHGEPVCNVEMVLSRTGGDPLRIVAHCIPILNEEKEVTGAATIVQDVTRRAPAGGQIAPPSPAQV